MNTANTIAKYITHQRCLGKRFMNESAILTAFSKSIGDLPLCDIRSDMVERFLDRGGTSNETIRKKHRTLSGFFRFAVIRNLLSASPVPRCTGKRGSSSYAPYIYREAELKRLLEAVPAATGIRSDIDANTLRAFVLLLYGAGLRRGEAMRLKIGDVDVPQSLLHIRGTKFFKTRIVPLSTSLAPVLRTFLAKRRGRHPMGADSGLFCKRNGEPLSNSSISSAFRRLRTAAGVRRDGGARNQPRLHDLRHSAAVHRVTAWYRCGADLNDLLPKLATYLDHKDLSGTQRYLTMTQELLTEASLRFEAFARGSHHD
jgi:integrase/recombinase XerD